MNSSPDSYSALERQFLVPARQLLLQVYGPVVRLLARLHVTPNMISFSQILLGVVVVVLIPVAPRLAFLVFVLAIVMDGLDGALARLTGQASRFGAIFDQYCDHIREVIVTGGLALFGTLNPLAATIYGLTYPAFNLTLYLCNAYGSPLKLAIKSYLIVYPAIFAYLWFGIDLVTQAFTLSMAFMWVASAAGLVKLKRALA